jgi:hypothetical protein
MKLIARRIIAIFFTILFICLPGLIHAQDCPDIGGVDPDYPCPIDSWVVVLLFVGVLYGLKKAGLFRKKVTGPLSPEGET